MKPRPPYNAVPSERIWPILEEWMNRNKQPRFAGDEQGGFIALARAARCDSAAIRKIPNQPYVRFDKADRLLCAIGRIDLWHTELADIYDRERPGAEQAA